MNKEQREEKFDDIYYNILGMCGCGRPKEVKQFLHDLLENHRQYKDNEISYEEMSEMRADIIRSADTDIIFEFIFHVFAKADLLHHGSSIYGSWFTEEGTGFLKLLSEFKNEN